MPQTSERHSKQAGEVWVAVGVGFSFGFLGFVSESHCVALAGTLCATWWNCGKGEMWPCWRKC